MKPIKDSAVKQTSEKEIEAKLSDQKLKKEELVQQEIDEDGSEIQWMMPSSTGYKNKPNLKKKPRKSKTKKTFPEPVKPCYPDEMVSEGMKGKNAAHVGGKKEATATSRKKAVEEGEATVLSQENVCKGATVVLPRKETKKGVYSGASELKPPFTRKDSKKVVAIKTVESATTPKNSLEAASIEAQELEASCLELGTKAAAKSAKRKETVGYGKKAASTLAHISKKEVAIGTKEPESASAKNSQEASSIVAVGVETAAVIAQVKPLIDTGARPKEKEVSSKKKTTEPSSTKNLEFRNEKKTTEPSSTKNQKFRNEHIKKNFSALRNYQVKLPSSPR